MRDPDLVVRAQLAAAALEGAWHRWRVVHGLAADPVPAVSSYVGYSLEEPWGQPRVVFGLAAEDAEQLAALIERHDCVGPVYAAVATMQGARQGAREVPPASRPGSPVGPLRVPRQAAAAGAEPQGGRPQADTSGTPFGLPAEPATDTGGIADCDEPVFRQAAAAMAQAAAAREAAGSGGPEARDEAPEDGSQPAVTGGDPEPGSTEPGIMEPGLPEPGLPEPGIPEHASDDPQSGVSEADDELAADGAAQMGSLAQAASAARTEAEARIRAALIDYQPGVGEVTQDIVFPRVPATDVLEPLPGAPRPEAASGAYIPPAAGAAPPGHDQDLGDPRDDASALESNDLPPGGSRRGRAARGYQIPRLSRTKRPGGVADAGQPAT